MQECFWFLYKKICYLKSTSSLMRVSTKSPLEKNKSDAENRHIQKIIG
jgi:hypothetical protein